MLCMFHMYKKYLKNIQQFIIMTKEAFVEMLPLLC